MRLLITFSLVLLCIGCMNPENNMEQKIDYSFIQAKEGQELTLEGRYEKSILAMRPETAEHRGHYKIVVNEEVEVVLLPPYNEASVRPEDEVARFEGKKVRVTGTISPKTYMRKPSFDYQSQSVDTPCFTEIKSVSLVEEQ